MSAFLNFTIGEITYKRFEIKSHPDDVLFRIVIRGFFKDEKQIIDDDVNILGNYYTFGEPSELDYVWCGPNDLRVRKVRILPDKEISKVFDNLELIQKEDVIFESVSHRKTGVGPTRVGPTHLTFSSLSKEEYISPSLYSNVKPASRK